jgi:hypothetical protein
VPFIVAELGADADPFMLHILHQAVSATIYARQLYADWRRGRGLVAAYCEIIATAP